MLESSARLQQLVPDAVLVGGSAAAWHAGHRISFDHDHVLTDLNQRFDAVLEALRIKAYLALKRNQTRDYLDIAALASDMGTEHAARVLRDIDRFYGDIARGEDAVSSQVARQLAAPQPRDVSVTRQLHACKGIQPPWDSWANVRAALATLAAAMVGGD